MLEIGLFSAFIAGLLTFISPCVLPLVPVYISLMSSKAIYKNKNIRISERLQLFFNSIFFVLGFSIVFIILGSTATAIGRMLKDYIGVITRIGGVILIIFGLQYMGLFRISFLNIEKRFNIPANLKSGYLGSFIIGVVFSFGLGVPFILTGIFISFFSSFFKKINKHLNVVSIISGIFLIILGIVFVTDSMTLVIGFLSRYLPFLNKINF